MGETPKLNEAENPAPVQKRDDTRTILLCVVALHLVVTLSLAASLNVWMDEAFTLDTTGKGFGYAFTRALWFELQPPAYFVVLNLWRTVNDSLFFARLFSVLCAAASIVVAHGLARRFIRGISPAWFAATIAFHPFTIYAATEARLYSFAILLSCLLLLTFFDGYLTDSKSDSPHNQSSGSSHQRRARIFHLMLAAIALYTQYYLGFLLVAAWCALLVVRRWRAVQAYTLGMMAVGIVFAPMLFVIFAQVTTHTAPYAAAPSIVAEIQIIYARIQQHLLPLEWEGLNFVRRWLLRFGLLIAPLVILLNRNMRRRIARSDIAVWTMTVVVTLFLFAALHATAESLVDVRHTGNLFPLLMLSTFIVFSIMTTATRGRKLLFVPVSILALFYVSTLFLTYQPLAKSGDWRRVASFIEAAEQAGQPVILYPSGNFPSLAYHYQGANPLVTLPLGYDLSMREAYEAEAEIGIIESLTREAANHERLWLVTTWECTSGDARNACQAIEDFLNQRYDIEQDRNFYRSRVRLFRRKTFDVQSSKFRVQCPMLDVSS